MAEKTHFTVVRNDAYGDTEFAKRQRHNERQNEEYFNGDIVPERTELNVHFQRYYFPDGKLETYEHTFNRLLATDTITKRGLKPNAKVFDEFVFDVNTTYFEENGGYDYAVKFFEEAYRLAVKEAGGEQYIISAVMHADERNKDLSEKLGRDIFHYHLHVVYVPVVEKEVYYRKDMKDQEKAGKLKGVITQISHSKKWPLKMPVERDGKTININSYSLLQDKYYEHMKTAGFIGFERGVRGSTAEHLNVLDFKIKKDTERLTNVNAQVEQSEMRLDELEKQAEKKEKRLEKIDEQLSVKKTKAATLAEINEMGHSLPFVPGVHFTDDEAKRLKALARQTVKSDERISKLKNDIDTLQAEINKVKLERDNAKIEVNHWHREYTNLWNEVKDFIGAIRRFPSRLREFISELFRPEREQQQQAEIKAHRQQHKSHNREEMR